MDGTFDQARPLVRLIPSTQCFSFDLKSATDRWPLVYLFEIVSLLFDRSFASSVVNSTLATNLFEVPFVRRYSTVSFVAGQPLGYYGSWPLFAFSHHLLVWWAAEQVRPGIKFDRYAVLGDDVLIADPDVARVYQSALQRLGVKIYYHKSLISSSGAAEFAKRFLIRVDLSPISMRALLGFHHPFGLMALQEKYKIYFNLLMRIGGAKDAPNIGTYMGLRGRCMPKVSSNNIYPLPWTKKRLSQIMAESKPYG